MAGGKKGNKKGGNPQKPEQAKEGGEEQFKFNFAQGGKQALDLGGKDAAILPMIQKKLDTLVGKSSGYFESLPKVVQDRIRALKGLQAKKSDLDKQYKKELEALQAKFDKMIEPLYERRREIVEGTKEATQEEIKAGPEEKKEEEEKGEVKKEETKEEKKEEEEPDVKGIPNFWLEAFKHHDDFAEMITPQDEKCLKYLVDVRWKSLPAAEGRSPSSFLLEFEFKPENPYFEQTLLTKTYYLTEHEMLGETMFDKMEGTDIKWKPGKNLTVKLVQIQQGKRGGRRGGRGRGKAQGGGKTTTVEEPCESFFNFFKSDVASAFGIEDEEMEDGDLQELYEADYEMGLAVKEQIISSAVLWFTGEIQDPFGPGDEGDSEEDGEYDSAEDPDFDEPADQPEGQKPECAQQ